MRGIIIGDVAGSLWEGLGRPAFDDPLFPRGSRYTDDTVTAAAVAEAILDGRRFGPRLHHWGRHHPDRGYGAMFEAWLEGRVTGAYQSFGNGSCVRGAVCGFLARSDAEATAMARSACMPTHDHPDAIAAAEAVAAAVRAGLRGEGADGVLKAVTSRLGAEPPDLEELYARSCFDVSAAATALSATVCAALAPKFGFEATIRAALHAGGDTDTTAAIAGAIAESMVGVPEELWARAEKAGELTSDIADIVRSFDHVRENGGLQGTVLGRRMRALFRSRPAAPKIEARFRYH